MAKITGIELTEQEARDILTTAVESGLYGIAYWATEHPGFDFWRDAETLDITRIKIVADNDKGETKTYDITTEKIKEAVAQIAQENGMPELVASILEEDVDSEGADIIVQVACFGQVIYG
jgi:hypothetical protein